jgi:hypothetical protein
VLRSKSLRIIHRMKNSCLVSCYDGWAGIREQLALKAKQTAPKAKSASIVYRIKNKCLVQVLEV